MRGIWIGSCLLAALLVACGLWLHVHSTQYDEIIAHTAARYELDFYLVKSVIYEESWFRPDIRGTAGDLGLMQVTMGAAADFTSRNGFPALTEERLIEPRMNLEVGCWYLRQALDHYRHAPDPTLFALLSYNAGEVRADNWLRLALSNQARPGTSADQHYLALVDFPVTREYVRRVPKTVETQELLVSEKTTAGHVEHSLPWLSLLNLVNGSFSRRAAYFLS